MQSDYSSVISTWDRKIKQVTLLKAKIVRTGWLKCHSNSTIPEKGDFRPGKKETENPAYTHYLRLKPDVFWIVLFPPLQNKYTSLF